MHGLPPPSEVPIPIKKEPRHGKGRRWPEEDIPSPNYIAIVEAKGPRVGETRLAYCKRMAVLKEVWRLWTEAWDVCLGRLDRVCAYLGIAYESTSQELRNYGLSAAILDELVLAKRGIVPERKPRSFQKKKESK
jgi:hypothetical protein